MGYMGQHHCHLHRFQHALDVELFRENINNQFGT